MDEGREIAIRRERTCVDEGKELVASMERIDEGEDLVASMECKEI